MIEWITSKCHSSHYFTNDTWFLFACTRVILLHSSSYCENNSFYPNDWISAFCACSSFYAIIPHIQKSFASSIFGMIYCYFFIMHNLETGYISLADCSFLIYYILTKLCHQSLLVSLRLAWTTPSFQWLPTDITPGFFLYISDSLEDIHTFTFSRYFFTIFWLLTVIL